ncbi:MAG: radical SAM family heme chaperone HemW [Leptospira sp.]|nr:radical SAM family heme chaperone HemW [Leptospira sp.]
MIKRTEGFAGLYIHFPYCIHKCSYCDFFSVGIGKNPVPDRENLLESYLNELDVRIQNNPELLKLQFDTIFFGGGTPSLAGADFIAKFLEKARSYLSISPDAEISLEANPEDISKTLLSELHNSGINRINTGIQSFKESHLKTLDRFSNIDQYNSVMDLLSGSEIKRFGADLIYGIPGQTKKEFYEDVNRLISSGVTHLSLYSLTVEKGTPYSRSLKDGSARAPQEELQTEILLELPGFLKQKNYHWYEVSNYCKDGEESRHNLKYWTMQFYLALGPGAHGFIPAGRYANTRSVENYLAGKFSQTYTKSEIQEEMAISLLRLRCPVEIDTFLDILPERKFILQKKINAWAHNGHCRYENGIFQWNDESILNLDSFIFEFATAE